MRKGGAISSPDEVVSYFQQNGYDEVEDWGENQFRIVTDGKTCADININNIDNNIAIDQLKKCNKSGKQILRDIDDFAAKYDFGYIKLEDDSKLYLCNSKIALAYLNILAYGESWYNKMGYYSLREKEHYESVLKMQLGSFLSLLRSKLAEKKKQNLSLANVKMLETISNTDFEVLGGHENDTVQTFFKHIMNKMREERNFCQKYYEVLEILINAVVLSGVIKYDFILQKQVKKGGLKRKTRRRIKQQRKSKKSRKYKTRFCAA